MTTKIWLAVAASLVIIGLIMFAGVMSVYGWDFSKLNTGKYETNTHEIDEGFNSLSIKTETADIIFKYSNDGKCRVECFDEIKAKHSAVVEDDTLVIRMVNEKSWYDYIGINFGSPKITVYLPKAEYSSLSIYDATGDIEIPEVFKFENAEISLSTGDIDYFASTYTLIKLKTSTGDICVEDTTAGELDLSVSTGSITVSNVICAGDIDVKVSTGKTRLNNVECDNFVSVGHTGDIFLTDVIAAEKLTVERNTGDIKFDSSDAAEIYVKTNTGRVEGSLLTDKIFITHTNTGKVNVPKRVTGGICDISTNTGNIKITIE